MIWAVFKSPTDAPSWSNQTGHTGLDRPARRCLGGRWHWGQKYDDRFMKATRRMAVPHRSHASASRP